jgi:mannan endo-1,4-beta-mannosidase
MRHPLLLFFLTALFFVSTGAWAVQYEAENGTLLGGARVDTALGGYSGSGYVDNIVNAGDGVQVTVNVPSAGMYSIGIQFASPYGPKTNDLLVNGGDQGGIAFPQTSGWQMISAGAVFLNAGTNTVGVTSNWGYIDVDYFTVNAVIEPPLSVSRTLVTPNPSPQAQALWCYLVDHYGKNILSGGTDTTWVKANIGKQEAIGGFDFEYYDASSIANGASTDTGSVDDAIAWAQAGGIVQYQWHWIAPMDLLNNNAEPWYKGFYTAATTFNVADAMNNPSSAGYNAIVADLDMVGYQLQRLRNLGIPVLWRPLHEAQGGWFWWGAQGAAPCTALYNLMYDRFTNHWGLNNLVWVWVSNSDSSALPWYPGDNMVDVVGSDLYPPAGDYTPSTTTFWNMVNLFGGKKMVAMTENGPIPDPALLTQQDAGWSWFMTWGNMVSDGNTNTLAHVQEVYNSPYVINQSQLPNLNTYACYPPTATPTSTWTRTFTNTPTITSTASPTPTNTMTYTPTSSWTVSRTNTPTSTTTGTNTATASSTSTGTWTNTFTFTDTNTSTSTDTRTHTPVPPTNTSTFTFTNTETNTPVPPTDTPTAVFTDTNTHTPVPPSATPSGTSTATSTDSTAPSATASWTPTQTVTMTDSTTATSTPSPSLTASRTASPSATLSPTDTFTATPTDSTTATTTSTSSLTNTWTPTGTPTPTRTSADTFTATKTSTPVPPSPTFTYTGTSTWTFSPTDTTISTPLPPTITPTPGVGPVLCPNPVTGPGPMRLIWNLERPSYIRVRWYTLSFRKVFEVSYPMVQGSVDIPFDLRDQNGIALANGLYYLFIETNAGKWTKKCLILK